jgi:uncharacterized protein (DUF305 family)
MEKKMLMNVSIKAKLRYLLVFGSFIIAPICLNEAKAQTSGIVIKAASLEPEDLMRPMNSMMGKIRSLKMSDNFEKDYVAIMQEFQQGGIDLCKIYKIAGEDPKLLEEANVSIVQLKEDQRQLRSFEAEDKLPETGKPKPNDLMETLNKMIVEMERKARSGDMDSDYATMMVLYDWAATEMGKSELHYGLNAELKNQARDMIEGFSCKENNLIDWLNKNSVANK